MKKILFIFLLLFSMASHGQLFTFYSSASTASFSPSDIDSMQLWLASDYGITKDGSNKVSAWADKSSNANNAVNSGSLKPLWVNAQIDSKPVIRFAAASTQFLYFTRFHLINYSMFIVYKQSGSSNAILGTNYLSQSYTSDALLLNYSGSIYHQSYSSNGHYIYRTSQSTTAYHLIEFLQHGDTSNIYFEGANQTFSVGGGQPITPYYSGLGYSSYGFWSGDIVEILIYYKKLKPVDRIKVEGYFHGRYPTVL